MRSIIISGGSRGIGKSIAERLFLDGYNISLGIRDLDSIKGSILDPNVSGDERLLITKYDAKQEQDSINLVNESLEKFGKIDTVIGSAGIFKNTPLIYKEEDIKNIEELLTVNLLGPWRLIKSSWNALERSGTGRIIVLVSMSGKRSKSNLAGYTVSKFALMGLCQTIRNEGWEKNIRITAICPGWVNTDMAASIEDIPKEDMTQPNDIAQLTSDLLRLPSRAVPFEISINCLLEK